MDKRYNIYYTYPDKSGKVTNQNMFGVKEMTQAILELGGEITGIIDSEKD